MPVQFFAKRRQQSVYDAKTLNDNDEQKQNLEIETNQPVRFNKQFKGKTASLHDSDVKALIVKYPTNYVKVKEYLTKNNAFEDI